MARISPRFIQGLGFFYSAHVGGRYKDERTQFGGWQKVWDLTKV